MQKISGVDAVRVSLNDGLTVLDLQASNAVTLVQLRKVLKDNGFVSKEAHVSARGMVVQRNSQLLFTVAGTGETFALAPGPSGTSAYDALERRARSTAINVEELKGTVEAGNATPARLALESVQ